MNGTIAVVGDVHGHFDAVDVRQLDAAGYDLILFVGDLTGYRPGSGVAVARAGNLWPGCDAGDRVIRSSP